MKRNIFVAALLLFIIGCTQQQSDQLTQQQEDQIKGELKAVIDSVIVHFVALDPDGALTYYSPEMFGTGENSLNNFERYSKGWIGFNATAASIKWNQESWDAIVLSKDFAITSLIGKLEIVLKSGDKMTVDPQFYSDVYKRVAGQWKIVFEHSSGIPVTERAGKK